MLRPDTTDPSGKSLLERSELEIVSSLGIKCICTIIHMYEFSLIINCFKKRIFQKDYLQKQNAKPADPFRKNRMTIDGTSTKNE